jgi:hypothetical protein
MMSSPRKPGAFAFPVTLRVARLLALAFASSTGCQPAEQASDLIPTQVEGVFLREIGPGNRQLELIDAVILDPEAGPEARIVQTTAQHGDALAVVFQPSTGETSYIRMTGASGARAISKLGEDIYIGTYLEGQLFRWRPGMDQPERIRIPRPNGERYEFVFSVERGSDGLIYIGTWPEGDLLRYDESSGTIENLGPMVDDPPHEYYLRHVNAGFDNHLFLSFGTEVALVDYDLSTGSYEDILPAEFRDRTWVGLSIRFRDMLVTLVDPRPALIFQDPASRETIRVARPDQDLRIWPHNYNSLQPFGEYIYFGTIEDDALRRYHFDSDAFEIVRESLGHPIGIAAERYLFTRTRLGIYSIFDLEADSVVVRRPSEFLGDGMLVHAISTGPDGSLVGGTYINQGLFVYRPETGEMYSPGRSVEFPGQIDNLTTLGRRLFIGHYTKARFSVYDIDQPWQPGYSTDSNPKFLGTAGEDQDRVPGGVVGPDGRVYFGTKPEYGKLGGSIVRIDPRTEEMTVFRNVVQDQSVYALVSDGQGHLYGSTSVRGGLGARPSQPTSKLFKWDVERETKIWERTIIPDTYEMWGLDWLGEGVLVGSADSSLFLFDTQSDSLLDARQVAPEEIKMVVPSDDGWIYAMTEERLLRVSPDLSRTEVIDVDSGYWDSMAESSDDRLFVGRGAILHEVVRKMD